MVPQRLCAVVRIPNDVQFSVKTRVNLFLGLFKGRASKH